MNNVLKTIVRFIRVSLLGIAEIQKNTQVVPKSTGITTYRLEGVVTDVREVINAAGEPVTLVTIQKGDTYYHDGMYGHRSGIQVGDKISYRVNFSDMVYTTEPVKATLVQQENSAYLPLDVELTKFYYQMVEIRFANPAWVKNEQ